MEEQEKKQYHVFIVDDDQFLVDMYVKKFEKQGFKVSHADSGQKALGVLEDGLRPDVVLLDITMPSIDGLEALKVIKEKSLAPHAAVIMLTNQSNAEYVDKAEALGVDGYIVKAVTIPSEIVTEVMKIVEKNPK